MKIALSGIWQAVKKPATQLRGINVAIAMGLGLCAASVSATPTQAIKLVQTTLGAQPPLMQPSSSATMGLYDVWQLGLDNDPSYKAAVSRFQASQAQKNISRAELLPQISAGYQENRVRGWREQPWFFGLRQHNDLSYDSTNMYARLQQPLINYPKYAEFRRGQAVAQHGQAQFLFNQQAISLLIAQSYFDTVLGYEDWRMQSERVKFLEHRLDSLTKLHQHQSITDIELAETQARLAISEAERLQAEDHLRTTARRLQSHIGQRPHNLRTLSRQWDYQPLTQSLDELVKLAVGQNREIQAAKQEVAMYQARLDAAVSQYFPTLDLSANFSRGESEDLATLSQRTNTFAVGVHISIPIFTGGYTTANKSQARHLLNQAQHRYDGTVGKVRSEVNRFYSLYSSGAQRVAALQKAVESSEISLSSALKSFSVGAASNLDILDAQDELLLNRYEYFKGRLETLMAQLQLYAALGEPLHGYVQTMSSEQFRGGIITLPMGINVWQDSADGWLSYQLHPNQSHPHYADNSL